MRTITHSEFVNGAGEGVYVSHVHYSNPAERKAGDAACQSVVVARAFTPFGFAGEAYDPPEYTPPPVSESYTTEPVSGGLPPNCEGFHAGEAQDPSEHFPPNCEGDNRYGQAAEILIELTEGDE